jgi:hypothetical protein
MSDFTEVRVDTLHAVAHDITRGGDTTSEVTERLRSVPAPAGQAFGNSSAGRAAHDDYLRLHQDLTDQTAGIAERLGFIGAVMRHAAGVYESAQTNALEAIDRVN